MEKIKAFLKRKNIIISAKRYGIDALGAMAQGLFASLLIGTIISTIGEQAGIQLLVDIYGFAHRVVTRHEVHRQHAGLRDICNRCVCVCTA